RTSGLVLFGQQDRVAIKKRDDRRGVLAHVTLESSFRSIEHFLRPLISHAKQAFKHFPGFGWGRDGHNSRSVAFRRLFCYSRPLMKAAPRPKPPTRHLLDTIRIKIAPHAAGG